MKTHIYRFFKLESAQGFINDDFRMANVVKIIDIFDKEGYIYLIVEELL